jgi:hypothetical protein
VSAVFALRGKFGIGKDEGVKMQPMTFHPVVGDIAAQLVRIGVNSLETGSNASMSMTGLAPAGAEAISAQAVTAFHAEATSMLNLNMAAQEELMRVGTALSHVAQTYSDVDETAARAVVFNALPMSKSLSHE